MHMRDLNVRELRERGMPKLLSSALTLSMVLLATSVGAAERENDRPRIGLALGGGGAAGFAHVGVIQELERLGIRPDCVTGTSMGAIVAGVYADGYTGEELERVVGTIDWQSILNDSDDRSIIHPARRDSRLDAFSVQADLPIGLDSTGIRTAGGLVDGVKLSLILRDLVGRSAGVSDFDALPIPFRAVAADLISGEAVILDSGDLAQALRASMSLPALFPPVEIDGKVLVDGGVVNNLPMDVAREVCGDVVIGVYIPIADVDRASLTTLGGSASRTLSIMIARDSRRQIAEMRPQDILITPQVQDIGVLDFGRVEEAVLLGAQAVAPVREQLIALAQGRKAPADVAPVNSGMQIAYERIEIDYDGPLSDAVIRGQLDLPDRGQIGAEDLRRLLRKVYGLDLFESVNYRLKPTDDGNTLVIVATQKSTGNVDLRIGLGLQDDFNGTADYTLALGTSFTQLTPLGARVDIDVALGQTTAARFRYEQPLNAEHTVFFRPDVRYARRTVPLYPLPNQRLADFNVELASATAALFWAPYEWGGVGASIGVDARRATLKTGDPALLAGAGISEEWRTNLSFAVGFDYDTLDDVDLPRAGDQVSLQVLLYPLSDDDESVGAVSLDALSARSYGHHTVSLFFYGEGELEPEAEILNPHFIGGFQRLSSLSDGELLGAIVGVAGARYYRRFGLDSQFGNEAFAGVSLEVGGAWRDWSEVGWDGSLVAGSVFVGIQTPLGPFIVGVGYGDEGEYAGHFSLGYRF